MKRYLHFTLAVVALANATGVDAQWSNNPAANNAVSVAADNQQSPAILADGAGGAFIVWEDMRSGSDYDIYAQRLDANGQPMWTADGVIICTATGNQNYPQLIADDAGGAIIVWQDNYSGNDDIYAQRVNGAGVVQWAPDGVGVCTEDFGQSYPKIVSDNAGGAIIVWEDTYSGNSDVFAQRINSSGVVQWLASGVAVCTAAEAQYAPEIIADGNGGAIVTWEDYRTGTTMDIYAQKISAAGAMQWGVNGMAVCSNSFTQIRPQLTSDGAGGGIFVWEDNRVVPEYHIYTQQISSAGVAASIDGILVSSPAGEQIRAQLTSDDNGGAIIIWQEGFSASSDIYAQRINSSGLVQWTTGGVEVCVMDNEQSYPEIISDENGGVFIIWSDRRDLSDNSNIYAQYLNSSGVKQWTTDGVAVATANDYQEYPAFTSDGAGGLLVTWEDSRSGNDDIYAQNICAAGNLGECNTSISEEHAGELKAFVNQEELTVELSKLNETRGNLLLTDLSGRVILNQPNLNLQSNSYTINIGSLASGIYTLSLQTENRNYAVKVFID
jgi:hypothetical protein